MTPPLGRVHADLERLRAAEAAIPEPSWWSAYTAGARETYPQAHRDGWWSGYRYGRRHWFEAGQRDGWQARIAHERLGWELMRDLVAELAKPPERHPTGRAATDALRGRTTLTGPELIAAAHADWGLPAPHQGAAA